MWKLAVASMVTTKQLFPFFQEDAIIMRIIGLDQVIDAVGIDLYDVVDGRRRPPSTWTLTGTKASCRRRRRQHLLEQYQESWLLGRQFHLRHLMDKINVCLCRSMEPQCYTKGSRIWSTPMVASSPKYIPTGNRWLYPIHIRCKLDRSP